MTIEEQIGALWAEQCAECGRFNGQHRVDCEAVAEFLRVNGLGPSGDLVAEDTGQCDHEGRMCSPVPGDCLCACPSCAVGFSD